MKQYKGVYSFIEVLLQDISLLQVGKSRHRYVVVHTPLEIILIRLHSMFRHLMRMEVRIRFLPVMVHFTIWFWTDYVIVSIPEMCVGINKTFS